VIEAGAVTEVEITESTIGDEAVEAGLVRLARRWVFPRAAGGGRVVVSFPFFFSP